MAITYGSICSGVEAASLAWDELEFEPLWFSEIEPFPKAVLNSRWPHVGDLNDMCLLPKFIKSDLVPAPDVLVGGTPCQSYSIAGRRVGLDDERGKLTLKFVEIANEIDAKRKGRESVIVWENVPGVLSDKGNAFGHFLGLLAGEADSLKPPGGKWTNSGCVFGPQRAIAWRVLDAQYFGLAQRRKRVFVVASARKGFNPREVLFESEGVRRDTAPSREPQQGVASTTESCSRETSQRIENEVASFAENSRGELRYTDGDGGITGAMTSGGGKPGQGYLAVINKVQEQTVLPIHDKSTRFAGKTGKGSGNGLGIGRSSDPMFTLTTTDRHSVFATYRPINFGKYAGDQVSSTLKARDSKAATDLVLTDRLRRLTPVESERLQGMPDNHTRISWRGKPPEQCPDGLRYKAIGNSKAVSVIRWIGKRVKKELLKCY